MSIVATRFSCGERSLGGIGRLLSLHPHNLSHPSHIPIRRELIHIFCESFHLMEGRVTRALHEYNMHVNYRM